MFILVFGVWTVRFISSKLFDLILKTRLHWTFFVKIKVALDLYCDTKFSPLLAEMKRRIYEILVLK